ncbi:MAG: CBS domain-containing protein [Halanaerobium sp.]
MKVKEIMTKDPITIDINSDVKEATRLLSYHNIGRLLVIKEGHLIGIVTDGDLMIEHERETPIRDFMSENLILINENQTIKEASQILAEHQISGLPVVNNQKSLIGIITVEDIVYRYLAQK